MRVRGFFIRPILFLVDPATVFPDVIEIEIAADCCLYVDRDPVLPESAKSPSPKSRKISGEIGLSLSVKLRRTSAMRAAVEPVSSAPVVGGGRNKAIIPSARAALIRDNDRWDIGAF
jgi:hypothetical protein